MSNPGDLTSEVGPGGPACIPDIVLAQPLACMRWPQHGGPSGANEQVGPTISMVQAPGPGESEALGHHLRGQRGPASF